VVKIWVHRWEIGLGCAGTDAWIRCVGWRPSVRLCMSGRLWVPGASIGLCAAADAGRMRRLGDDIIAGEAAREAFGGIMDGCGVDGALDLDSSLVARGDMGAGCAIDARMQTLDPRLRFRSRSLRSQVRAAADK
jgi:hypothetical protein